ncbi:virulence RhuM family protein [Roseospira visakhapatnamensis]|uniref:Hydroxyacid dehydrogenase n=1 Tax=Roseospira visakhapatnamensis TaxID=390880 RepID=A0A7W6RGI1_9PROT|nr:virulence RhuM family protein [Roseospira visakhapatnamensis]MBB4268118.1 hypothetical protein [Roseospira visakhapatnamensis]
MSGGEVILYRTEDGRDSIQLQAVDGTVWLTQAEMAALFDTTPQAITQLIRAIYADAELDPEATCKDFLQVRSEGAREVRRKLKSYTLDMILAVGYRVRSPRGIQFRRWATTALTEYLVKGFVMNDERLKDPGGFDYFDELLERIRDIRASEKRFYQKVRDLFAQTSADYDGTSETARLFFQTIQNKMLFAVTGQTAAEIIVSRADPSAPNMGLTSWKGKVVRKADVATSKNYLAEHEVGDLNRLVTMFLEFAEFRAQRRMQTTMQDWVAQTDRFLEFNEQSVLNNAGTVAHDDMVRIVHDYYATFEQNRRGEEARIADAEHEEDLKAIENQISKKISKRGKHS